MVSLLHYEELLAEVKSAVSVKLKACVVSLGTNYLLRGHPEDIGIAIGLAAVLTYFKEYDRCSSLYDEICLAAKS